MKYKCKHIFADYINLKGDENVIGNFIFYLMEESIILNSNMKIVHKFLSILNNDTPAGFTSVLLLDESHFTCHAYTEEGLLMIDIATCGTTDTNKVMEHFNNKLMEKYPHVKRSAYQEHNRFVH